MFTDAFLFLIVQHIMNLLSVGPCTVLVVRTSLISRKNGIKTVFGAILGAFLIRVLLIFGMAFALTKYPFLFNCFRVTGAAYLIFYGVMCLLKAYKTFITKDVSNAAIENCLTSPNSNFWSGFLMSISNPLVAIQFVALFSTVIQINTSLLVQLAYLTTLSTISLLFYIGMALFFSAHFIKNKMVKSGYMLDIILGIAFTYWGIKIFMQMVS